MRLCADLNGTSVSLRPVQGFFYKEEDQKERPAWVQAFRKMEMANHFFGKVYSKVTCANSFLTFMENSEESRCPLAVYTFVSPK